MDAPRIRSLVQSLADRSARGATARAIARELGADELIVFTRDPELGVRIPAPGFARTVPGGPQWDALLAAEPRAPGSAVHPARVPWGDPARDVPALGIFGQDGLLLVVLGGEPSMPDLEELSLPLLGALFLAEVAAEIADARSVIASSATRNIKSLIAAVDAARAEAESARAAAESAARAKDEFLAMLGHELRNPLSPIVTALEILRTKGNAGTREFGVISRQVEHLQRLVDDLLDIARITRGKVDIKREPLDVSVAVAKGIEMARPLLDRQRHTLSVSMEPALFVRGDRDRLAQVLSNLLNNAAKYTDPGGHIVLEASRQDDDVILRVRDDGIGISPELLPRVFDLFQQGARGRERAQGGLGIGLALVRNIVAMHEGSVSAHSEGAGRGSEFVVRLPAVTAGSNRDESAPAPVRVAPAERRRRVLLVDDNVDATELLAEFLRSAGHTVETAHDGPRALKIATSFDADVALLDLGLPVMDGYDLAAQLRSQLPRPPTLIALTGYGQAEDRARTLDLGFATHLVKPIVGDRLLRLLDEL